MAATPFPPPLTGSSYMFDIYNDTATAAAVRSPPTPNPTPNPNLPGGPCNFVDLAHGVNSAKCGCRRFWSRQVVGVGNYTVDQMGWCMCSHHACFHDDAQASGPQTQAQTQTQTQAQGKTMAPAPMLDAAPNQENEKPRINREPLSPVQDLASFHMPSSLGGAAVDFATLNFESFGANIDFDADLPQADFAAPAQDNDSMPDTLSWRNCVPSQRGLTSLPPIPSQCLMPSQTASTTASSQMRYLKPFGGKGLNTLSSVSQMKARHPPREWNLENDRSDGVTPDANKDGQTPRDVPDLSGAATPTAALPSQIIVSPPGSVSPGSSREAIHNLSELIVSHEQRLDKLENASIDGAAHEVCEERIDGVDVKVYELESRMDDVERRLNDDNTSVVSSRPMTQRDDDATISVLSGSTNAMARPGRPDVYTQLQALQSRVNQLEASSLPSYNAPWELEVVFLPFALRGVWMEAPDFPTQRQSQQPNTNSRATPDPQTHPHGGEWVGPDSNWLLPRACAPGRMIDQRLRSRGLIKAISVRGCDARSVQLAVGHAFENTLHAMPITPGPYSHRSPYGTDPRVSKYLGLQQDWVPLRKVHKDSRLRFLSPAEMITPVLWDVAFLMNSVVMKATGIHRLYVTQPEAYLQDHRLLDFRDSNSGWTWQKLRELDRVYADSQSSSGSVDVPEADALEEYWTWNDRLDELPSSRQSIASLHQLHDKLLNQSRTSDGSTQQFFTGPSNTVKSVSPAMFRGQSPLCQVMERQLSRPPNVRTGSMPPVAPSASSPPGEGRRRVASHNLINNGSQSYQRHSSPLVTGRPSPRLSVSHSPAVAMISKTRRRDTRSPSLRPHNTPRWSTRSYSRSPSVVPFGLNGVFIEGPRDDRRLTPFAYATPFSNAPAEFPAALRHTSRSNVYEDDDMTCDDEGRGSSTDAYGDSDVGDEDPDIDIDVYEDDGDKLDDLNDPRHEQVVQIQHQRDSQDAQQINGPEDEPWPGIEDEMSDGENLHPFEIEVEGDDTQSDVSSQPSEYPSTQRAWRLTDDREMTEQQDDGGAGFRIHVDERETPTPGSVTQWP